MRALYKLLICTASCLYLPSTAAAITGAAQDVTRELQEESRLNRRLELELGLAREPSLYFLLDINRKTVEIRIRGVVLKSFPVDDILALGRVPRRMRLLTLKEKDTRRPPERTKINPQPEPEPALDQKPAAPYKEPDIFDLADMPSRYSLVFEEGLTVVVRPAEVPREEKGMRGYWTRFTVWGSDMMARVKQRMGRNNPSQLRVTLSDEACRSIFWSFAEGGRAILVP